MVTEARLWEVDSGREVCAFSDAGGFVALSPGGELLATNDRTVVVLREAATGRELGRLRGHNGWVGCGSFAAGGRVLVTGSDDTTALVWDVSAFLPRARPPALAVGPGRPLGGDEAERLWAELASEDASAAYRAIVALASAGDAAVRKLGDRLRPVVGVDAARLSRLVADLDDERFAVRQQATRELETLGELAEGALRQAIEKPASVETRRRAEQILERLAKAPLPAETLRGLRAIEALERIGTDKAREMLRRLAGGAPEARLTREAKAALDRLGRGRPVSP
jgi:hypothetical protein